MAVASPGVALPRRVTAGSAGRFKALSAPGRQRLLKPAASLGRTGVPGLEGDKPFSPERALEAADRVESLTRGEAPVADQDALHKALGKVPSIRDGIARYESGSLTREDVRALARQEMEMENLEGIALKGARHAAAYRPPKLAPLPEGLNPGALSQHSQPEGGTTKTNTGWILDQHVFDPASSGFSPTLISDFKHYDEGQNDITMGHSDHPGPGTMFGWVWQVQSFYWTDITVPDHATPSYCLFVMVSSDGGFTWQLYEILYDPTSASHAVSLDMINPKLAMDITGTYDRYSIAYEKVKSATDHDVYVYSETSVLDEGTPDPQDVGVGTSTNMERNPAIASDYKTGEASYRVVAYEYAYSSTDYDLYAAQSTGNGSVWTTPVAVAATTGMETHPALSAGCSGAANDAYMHLAYNFDSAASGGNLLLLDRGFESGPLETDWYKFCTNAHNIITTTSTHSGTYKASLCGYNSEDDKLSQLVTIPADAAAAQMSFYLRITTSETTHPYDFLYVRVWDATGPPGAPLATLATYSDADAATYSSWTLAGPIDLSAYVGQTVRIGFEGVTDASYATAFYIDDTSLSLTLSRVQYSQGAHSSADYPASLQGFTKAVVLSSRGTTAWPYGPPAIAASHGGSATVPGGRLAVAADQLFPADQLNPGDPSRYQLIYAVNMCNGEDTCGDIAGCFPARSLGWSDNYFFEDRAADYRFPSLVADGVGWVEGTSGLAQNGIAEWPEIFIAYYYRELQSGYDFGSVQMLLADASDESCEGFASGAWYQMTASPKASDGDDRVVAKQGTIAAFNYFYGWPGVCFNKRLNHFGANVNDDVYFTTLGDNYVIDTLSGGSHINAYYTYNGVSYVGPWTFPWPAGYDMTVTADARATDNGLSYAFSAWSTGDKTAALGISTGYCGVAGPCPTTSIDALYNEVGALPLRVPYSATPTQATSSNHGTDLAVTWDAGNCASANYHLLYGKGEGLPSWTADGGMCALGASGTYAWGGVPDPSAYTSRFLWFLVVGDDGAGTEGSWGLTYPGGAEEGGAGASNLCGMTTKDLSGTCGTP